MIPLGSLIITLQIYLLSLLVKELWKSITIWQSCGGK